MKVGEGGANSVKVKQTSVEESVPVPRAAPAAAAEKSAQGKRPSVTPLEIELPPKTPAPVPAASGFEHHEVSKGAMGLLIAGHRPPVDGAMSAIQRGDVAALRTWIKAGGDVNGHDASGMTPLSLAAVRGNLEAMRALLDGKARIDVPHAKSGALPLHMAASGGSVDAVQLLISAGASLEATWPMNGHTPLVEAIFKNNAAAARALLDAGADATKVTIRGVGTLDLAMRNTALNAAVIERLDALFVARGDAVERRDAQGNAVQVNGRTVHDIPATEKQAGVRRIFDQVRARDASITPPLRMDSAFADVLAAADRGDVDAVRAAIDADPGIVNQRGGELGTTPLILASVAGRADVVRLLLDRGADPNLAEVHPMGVHALFKAAVFGHTAIGEMLVNAGAHMNDQGAANGMTPLHDAVLQGRDGLVRVLLRAGARADIEDYTGATALQFARTRGNAEVRAVFDEIFPSGAAT